MIEEMQQRYEVQLNASDFNEYGILKPYVIQQLFEQVAERHLVYLGLSISKLMEFQLAWALVSITVEIQSEEGRWERLIGKTWYSQRKGPYFRREIVFTDLQDKPVFWGSTFSILLDLQERSIFRKKELPFSLTEPITKFMVEARPTFRNQAIYQFLTERKVENSHLDCLGHVNNCRYGEFLYDAFSVEQCNHLNRLKRMELYFSSELRRGEQFLITGYSTEQQVFLRGSHQDHRVSFDGVFMMK